MLRQYFNGLESRTIVISTFLSKFTATCAVNSVVTRPSRCRIKEPLRLSSANPTDLGARELAVSAHNHFTKFNIENFNHDESYRQRQRHDEDQYMCVRSLALYYDWEECWLIKT